MSRVRIATIALAALLASNTLSHAAAGGGGGAPVPGVPAGGTPVTPWVLMACPALIVLAAFIHHQHRELTAQEAWLCGIPALFPWTIPASGPPLQVKG